ENIAVERVERGIVDVRSEHTLAQIVEHHDTSASTQPAESLLVQIGPGLGTGTEHQESNRLAAVAERQHEQACTPVLAAERIADHGARAVIDLGLFAGCRFDHGAGLRRVLSTELTDEAFDALIAA